MVDYQYILIPPVFRSYDTIHDQNFQEGLLSGRDFANVLGAPQVS